MDIFRRKTKQEFAEKGVEHGGAKIRRNDFGIGKLGDFEIG